MPVKPTRRPKPIQDSGAKVTPLSATQIVASLASGVHPALLEGIFGTAEYRELRKLARQAIKANALNKRQSLGRVYLLPGIMGSTLGRKTQPQHSIWLNPQAIAAGELLALALPAKAPLQAQGIMLPGYLKLKLHLQIAGFDVVFHPFDWRKSVLDSGKLLAQRIAHDGAKNISIVAHSMGGLVARAALAKDSKQRIARIVQLGTPNFGSFALVQALRGAYPTVRKVAALDPTHSTDQLVRHVFRTLPGLYEMLPTPAHTKDLDLLQLDSWPDDLLGPDATLLGSATRVRAQLGAARAGCFHIVGVQQETTTRARKGRKGFDYGITHDGDGTVPRALAEWPGAATWYVQERHGNLTKNDSVCKAVIDLLKAGRTQRLSRELPAASHAVLRWVSDAELRRGATGHHKGKVQWQQLSMEERRRILEPVISAEFHKLADH
jgi:pimeloyl-ACP methyl ester carboxylesterase